MKTLARLTLMVTALGTAVLFVGCANYGSNRSSQRARSGSNFEIVETSTKRLLTPQEMAALREKVGAFLDKEGATAGGDYYVKVYLAPDKDGVSSEWVVVRYSRDTNVRYTLLGSAASGYDRSYYSYDYYPYGYNSFGRMSFQYYNDPYYGSRYYYPSHPVAPPSRGHDHNRRPEGRGDKDDHRGHVGNAPGDKHHNNSNDHLRNRSDDNPRRPDRTVNYPTGRPRPDSRPTGNYHSPDRNPGPRDHGNRHRGESARHEPDRTTQPRSYSPPAGESSPRSYSPPPAPVEYPSNSRSEPASNHRNIDNTRIEE